jgi:peptidoglycan/LPS O-acetylase OafA/YrhL
MADFARWLGQKSTQEGLTILHLVLASSGWPTGSRNAFMTRGLSLYLDLLRVLAALQVAVFHLGWFEPVGFGAHVWNRWGHEAVVIFFVLSGFVIRHAVSTKDHTFTYYAASRLSRLYAVVIPCIVLTLLFDAVGQRLTPELYRNAGIDDTAALYTVRLLFSLFMLNESWLSVGLGSNAPYWSVCYEFWYYVLFGVYFYSAGWQRIAILAGILLVAGPHVLLLLPIWILGTLIYSAQVGQNWSRPIVWLAFAQVLAVFACHVYFDLPQIGAALVEPIVSRNLHWSVFVISDTLLGLSFAVHLVAAKRLDQPLFRALGGMAGVIRAAAARSFTLYLIHMPLMLLLTAIGMAMGLGPSPGLIGVGTVMLPLLLAPTIENQRHRLRPWLLRLGSRWVHSPVLVGG